MYIGIIANKARCVDVFVYDLYGQVGGGIERGLAVVRHRHGVFVRPRLTLDAGVDEHLPALRVHPEELHVFLGRHVERQVRVLTKVGVRRLNSPLSHVEDLFSRLFRLVDPSDVVLMGEDWGVVVDILGFDGDPLNGATPFVRGRVVQSGHAERVGWYPFPV